MAVLSEDYHDPIVDCKKSEQDACSYGLNEDQFPPKKEPCQHEECFKTPTIIDKQNAKEGGNQEKEERQDGGKSSGN